MNTVPMTISGFVTMNNVRHKARLKGPTIDNPVALAECASILNADITDTNSLVQRDGTTSCYSASNVHSIWSNGTECYFVEGTTLKRLLPTFTSAVSVKTLVSSLPMSYAQVNYLTVCSNGIDLFMIENGVAYSFTYSSKRFKEAVEAGHIVALFNRRLYVAIDNVLYYTDADDIQRLDERDAPFAFNGRIRGVYPLQNGMYVMADKVYWLSGKGPDDFTLTEAFDGKLIEGCAAIYDGSMVGAAGKRVRFVTTEWICDGDDSGTVQNLTMNTLSFTQAGQRGAALIRKSSGYNQFIAWV